MRLLMCICPKQSVTHRDNGACIPISIKLINRSVALTVEEISVGLVVGCVSNLYNGILQIRFTKPLEARS